MLRCFESISRKQNEKESKKIQDSAMFVAIQVFVVINNLLYSLLANLFHIQMSLISNHRTFIYRQFIKLNKVHTTHLCKSRFCMSNKFYLRKHSAVSLIELLCRAVKCPHSTAPLCEYKLFPWLRQIGIARGTSGMIIFYKADPVIRLK